MDATNLATCLEASARRFPDRIAVVDPDGTSLTYRELNHRASCVAGMLHARGVQAGDRVGLLLPKSAAAVTAIFGILKAGAAYVPADFTAPAERNCSILGDCQVRAAFLDPRCDGVLDRAGASIETLILVARDGRSTGSSLPNAVPWEEALASEPHTVEVERNPDALAYILYTSGSTGIPKGVMLTHRNALSFVDWCSSVFQPVEMDRFSSHAPFHFDLSVLDIYVSLKHGAALYLVSEDLGKNPKELAAFIEGQELTVWYSTPSILSLLAQFGGLEARDCSRLRLVLFAGEVFPVKHLRRITELWPGAEYCNLYGPTETNVCTFARIPLPIPPDRQTPYPIGPACSHCEPMILDEPGGVELPKGEEGLLYIAGPSVFPGYWNRPVENAAAFVERAGRRWYNTGDVVREEEGEGFVYLGRRDRMVKRRGYRIELGEIERCLYQHERIREAAVVSVSDANAGVRILAYLTPQPGERPSIIAMKAFCAQHLPAYMNPDVFAFVESLPRTSTNKVDYQTLRAGIQPQSI
jgi:amino acid adenylation domain-containing protein